MTCFCKRKTWRTQTSVAMLHSCYIEPIIFQMQMPDHKQSEDIKGDIILTKGSKKLQFNS